MRTPPWCRVAQGRTLLGQDGRAAFLISSFERMFGLRIPIIQPLEQMF
nr:MAG TPA: hypothetical protein [Caudoviricetes sp.]